MKAISSTFPIKHSVYALILGISLSSYAQGAESFTPGHPQCSPKVALTPVVVAEPAPKAVPAAVDGDADGDGVVNSKDECPDTPHGYKVDPKGCPVSVTLHLHFAFDSSVIPVSDYPEVEKLAKIMKENPPAKAIIVGHTDSIGTDAYNQGLSERRSKSFGAKLVENGIEADRIITSGKGEKEPIASNSTKEGRADNRRIEVKLH